MGAGISRERAVEIAGNRISGHVTISADSTPPFVEGPDYDAKVWVEKRTGKVLRVLGGS